MGGPGTDRALVSIYKFLVYLVARQEAIETLLIESKAVSKKDLRDAVRKAEASMSGFGRVADQDEESFARELADLLWKLKSRLPNRLKEEAG